MSRRPFSFPGRVGYWLMCMAVISALAGCSPKITPSMSDEDLQTCDNTAATIKENVTFPVSPYDLKYKPFMTTPGEAVITSPLSGGVFPFEPLSISFTQPPPDPNISFRILKVYVTPIDTISLSQLYHPLISSNGVVASSYQNTIEYHWTPESSGKFIILVFFRNLKNGGNPDGLPKIDFGPPSLAHVCVKIDVLKAGDVMALSPQPGTIMPLLIPTNLVPSFTPTYTPSSTLTRTPTLTSSPTATSTFTLIPPTRIPPTRIPPTSIPPTAIPNCSAYTEKDVCERNGCSWNQGPSGAGVCK